VPLTIGELAQRLRVSTRTLRHYAQLGLLLPEHVDARTGYRTYGEAQLVRGTRIEQLKTTGMSLSAIKESLESTGSAAPALRQRRQEIEQIVADHAAQLGAIDALLAAHTQLASPELVEVPARHVLLTRWSSEPDDLARTIRRAIQQLGRRVRQRDGVRCRSFSARFPVDVSEGPIAIEVAGHVDQPTSESIIQAAETHLKVVLVGNIGLLPLAYDVALTAVRERGLQPCGTAIEHYLDLSVVGRTEVAIPVCV
jgi:DNA-binding transcriptional MerR regulator